MTTSNQSQSSTSITSFLNNIENAQRKSDSKKLYKWMKELSGLKPAMSGDKIVGFGSYKYRYASGREGESFRIGFSPRAQGMSIYLMSDFEGEEQLLQKIGKHKMGRCCMTFKRLDDLNTVVLKELITKSARGKICSEVSE